jgi:hypothetical protein
MNTPVDKLRPYPLRDGSFFNRIPGNKLPGYHHLVPSGQKPFLPFVHQIDSTSAGGPLPPNEVGPVSAVIGRDELLLVREFRSKSGGSISRK